MIDVQKYRFGRLNLTRAITLTCIFLFAGCASETKEEQSVSLGSLLKPILPASPSEVARDAFNPDDPDTRREAVNKLAAAKFGHEEPYVRIYRMMLGSTDGDSTPDTGPDPDATVRAAALKALGTHGSVDDISLITPLLEDEISFVRWEAAIALQRIHNPAAIRPLMAALSDDEDADVRMAAADALGQYPEPAVFDALVGALEDDEFGTVEAARQSLATLTGYDFGTDAALWLMWAERSRGKLFQYQKPYAYQPYTKPPTLLQKAAFWKKPNNAATVTPTGYNTTDPAG